VLVCTLGDLLLDVIVRLEQPLAPGADARARIVLSTGGQAANVAAWAAALGVRARVVAKHGDDDAGRIARRGLEALGVEIAGPRVAEGTGVVVSLVAPGGERSMCPDRKLATELAAEELDPGWLECTHLHLSGYALVRTPVRLAALHAAELARAYGARVSVDLSSWSAIRDFGPRRFRTLLAGLEPDVVFANEEEDRIVGGRLAGTVWILKRGARGCSFDGDERRALPADPVDTTGAGDALAAGWLVGGPELALEAARRCVGQLGALP
jgi:sugar/nucleoside kinase (ribokinase family)